MAPSNIRAVLKLYCPAGELNAGHTSDAALFHALLPYGLPLVEAFCKQFNERTKAQRGRVLPVTVTIFEDGRFSFIVDDTTSGADAQRLLRETAQRSSQTGLATTFSPGQKILVTEGPFVNFTGTIDQIQTSAGKLKVIVSIFGRETPVELEFWQVKPA